MRLITILVEPALPDLSIESLAPVLDGAGVEPEHVYLDVAGSATRIGLYVRCEVSELDSTAKLVVAALAPLAGEDRLVHAQTHSWAGTRGDGLPWW